MDLQKRGLERLSPIPSIIYLKTLSPHWVKLTQTSLVELNSMKLLYLLKFPSLVVFSLDYNFASSSFSSLNPLKNTIFSFTETLDGAVQSATLNYKLQLAGSSPPLSADRQRSFGRSSSFSSLDSRISRK